MQESNEARAVWEEQQMIQEEQGLLGLEQAALAVYGKWKTLEVDRILSDLIGEKYANELDYTVFTFRSKHDTNKLFSVIDDGTSCNWCKRWRYWGRLGESITDHGLRIEYGWSTGHYDTFDSLKEVLKAAIVERGGCRPDEVEFVNISRRVKGLRSPVYNDFLIELNEAEIIIGGKVHWSLQKIEEIAGEFGLEPGSVLGEGIDSYIDYLFRPKPEEVKLDEPDELKSQVTSAMSSPPGQALSESGSFVYHVSREESEERRRREEEQRIMDERRQREAAELEERRSFLVGRMVGDSANEAYWREMLRREDPMISDEDIFMRIQQARREGPSYYGDDSFFREWEYRNYPPPPRGDYGSGNN